MQKKFTQIAKRLLLTLYLYVFLYNVFIFCILYFIFGTGYTNLFDVYIKGLFLLSYNLFYISIPILIILYFLYPLLNKFFQKNKIFLWLLAIIIIILFIIIYAFPSEVNFRPGF
jgi:hypothetical protein